MACTPILAANSCVTSLVGANRYDAGGLVVLALVIGMVWFLSFWNSAENHERERREPGLGTATVGGAAAAAMASGKSRRR